MEKMEKPEGPEKLVYSIPEVAEVLGLSKSNTYDLVHRGLLPGIRIRGRVLVPKQAITQLLERSKAS